MAPRRLWSNESAVLDVEMFIQHDDLHQVFAKADEPTAQAFGIKSLALHDANTLEHLDRAELRLTRLHDRAMRSLTFLQQNRPTEPEPPALFRPLYSGNISTIESAECSSQQPANNSAPSETEAVEEPIEDLPDSNVEEVGPETGDRHVEQRYEYQPDWPAHTPAGSRFQEVFDPAGPKPGPDVQ